MLEDCDENHAPADRDDPAARGARGGAKSGLQAIGCAGRLTGFSETEDGRYMITLSGISRFRVRDEVQGFTPYRRCQVDWARLCAAIWARPKTDPGFRPRRRFWRC